MSFAFRLRFRTAKGFISDDPWLEVPGPDGVAYEVAASPDGVLRSAKWLSVRRGGYETGDAAREAAKALRQQLLIAGTVRWMGFDFGRDVVTSGLFDGFRSQLEEKEGARIRNNIHGLDIFEEDLDRPTKFVTINATGTVTMGTKAFAEVMASIQGQPLVLSDRQLVSMELINDSLFPASTDAQFLTRVSAIEVLCERGKRPPAQVAALISLAASLDGCELSTDERKALRQFVLNGQNESISDACRNRVGVLLGADKVDVINRIYKARSRLVHSGEGRGQTAEIAGEALSLATDLLKAELGLHVA